MSYAVMKPVVSKPEATTVSDPMYVSPGFFWCTSFGGVTSPSAPLCEQTKYMSSSGLKEDGGQLSPPTAALAIRLIELGSELIGVNALLPTIFGFGFCSATPSSVFSTASGVASTGLNGSIVGSGCVGQVFSAGSCGTLTSGIGETGLQFSWSTTVVQPAFSG